MVLNLANPLHVPYLPRGFSAGRWPGLQARGRLPATLADLVRSAVTVGKPGAFYRQPNLRHVELDFGYRALLVRANVAPNLHSGLFVHRKAFELLDPSEKGAVSYFLGITICKLFAEKLFDVPFLQHLALFESSLQPTYWALGSLRPDLVGLDRRRDWTVFEAKGRSGATPPALLRKAKNQTRYLRDLNGQLLALRAACVSGFPRGSLAVRLRDPVEPTAKAVSVEVPLETYLETYYSPMRVFLGASSRRSTVRVGDEKFVTAALRGLDVRLGLNLRVLDGAPDTLPVVASDSVMDGDSQEVSVGTDGTFCSLGASWNE